MGDATTMAGKMTFQKGLAHHEGMWRAAWCLLRDTNEDVFEQLERGDALTLEMRSDMRMAATYATEATAAAISA